MKVSLEKAVEKDAQAIYEIQVKAFMPLLLKYRDYDTNPGNETIERVIERINKPNGGFYKIIADTELVGAICVSQRIDSQFWISPMFILPSYQGKGIAQKVLTLIEEMFPQACSWELATLLEEERNCHLYEKMGYNKTGVSKKLNDNATLIFYKKVCNELYSGGLEIKYNVEISLVNNDEFSNFLQQNIREFNNEHSFYHREKRKENGVKPINIIVSDNENNWIGGLNANVYWGWIEINDFWLKDEYRGKGLGSNIIDQAEKIAKEQGAKKALLYTFEFQARIFYEQKGYKVVGEVTGYPPGSSYYTMVKTF